MDIHPSHWQATLLGHAFWRDAEAYNKPIHDSIEAEGKRLLHRRQEQPNTQLQTLTLTQPPTTPMPDPSDTEAHRHRRFSMSDALHLHPFHSTHLSRRRARSSMRSDASDHTTTSSQEPRPRSSSRSRDHATPANPILEFRGGDTWDLLLARDRKSLGLDLFWPIEFPNPTLDCGHPTKTISTASRPQEPKGKDKDEQGPETFPLASLTPLLHFRHLRALKLTGMMRSYQKYIWQVAWLNPHLEELELGMALAPSLRRSYVTRWPCIRGGWSLPKERFGGPVYYGTGTGALHPALGIGEYLDKLVIEKAKVAGMGLGRTRTRLSIRTLALSGFVVDADPFLQWFDCGKLKCVRFGDGGGEVGQGVAGRVVEKGEIRVVRVR
ncbi:hypothetical protein ANOM_007278 [Aspergillus nomiae NRRL 13137]|uniref:Uncharacterized protein n=1 Tax=Aspergillus nomiae NRRL (strain ATCC 15546 / NRRL 13137 / CBS 260.88 / M93) TaxID=1509407 RepID=A0A0L1IXJ8_ASPN3|nr:uncharacterized protein ANOM_007278 [Aspergillus nomiae NRRL 13137]KNG84222.1 hypothetical protein ANOM_007278 [Aspergillus nomiae NRRL 13137]